MSVDVFTLVSTHLDVRKKVGNKVYCVCPSRGCGDESGHLVVYTDTKWTKCHRCGRSVSLRRLFKGMGIETPGVGKVPARIRVVQTGKVKLPGSTVPLGKKPRRRFAEAAYDYLTTTRKVDSYTSKKYELSYCFSGKYRGRIIVPVRNERGEVVYFVARDVGNTSKMKYKNPPAPKGGLFFGMDRAMGKKTVFIVEGVFDAIRIGDGALAALGKTKGLTDEHKDFIASLDPELVVVLFDADAEEDASRLAIDLDKMVRVAVLVLPDGDPDSKWDEIKSHWEDFLVTSGFHSKYMRLRAKRLDERPR